MTFIIRDLRSGLFYNSHGWTTAIEFAERFLDLESVRHITDSLAQEVEAAIVSEYSLRIIGEIPVRFKPKTQDSVQ